MSFDVNQDLASNYDHQYRGRFAQDQCQSTAEDHHQVHKNNPAVGFRHLLHLDDLSSKQQQNQDSGQQQGRE